MVTFSRLIPLAVSSFALQLGLACIFVPRAEDRFFDVSGTSGFLLTTLVSAFPAGKRLAPRQLWLMAALIAWATRLGAFLGWRAHKAGGDTRFAVLKRNKLKFTMAWLVQGMWVFVVGLPVYLSNSVPEEAHPPLGVLDYCSMAWIGLAFVLEVAADFQKTAWRRARDEGEHHERFITSGLWGWSRHPNYVGEVGIWMGMWGLAMSGLDWRGVVVSGLSPLGTYLLLRYASGVPPLERAGDDKFGDDPEWRAYKRSVPVLFPWGGYE